MECEIRDSIKRQLEIMEKEYWDDYEKRCKFEEFKNRCIYRRICPKCGSDLKRLGFIDKLKMGNWDFKCSDKKCGFYGSTPDWSMP